MQEFIIAGPRQSGKTSTIIDEMYRRIVKDRSTLLVVLPDIRHVEFFAREWQRIHPHMPRPEYATITNTLRLRGRRWDYIYVDNVDMIPDGIYNDKMDDVRVACQREIIYTYTPDDLSTKLYDDYVSPEQRRRSKLDWFRNRRGKRL